MPRSGETRKKKFGPGPGVKKTKRMARRKLQANTKSAVRFGLFNKGLLKDEGLEIGKIVRLEGDRAAVETMKGQRLRKTLRIMGAIRREFPRKLTNTDPTYVLHNGEEIVAIAPAGEVLGPAPEGFEWNMGSSSAGKKNAATVVKTRKAAHKAAKREARATAREARTAAAAAREAGLNLFKEKHVPFAIKEFAGSKQAPPKPRFAYRGINSVRLAAFMGRGEGAATQSEK